MKVSRSLTLKSAKESALHHVLFRAAVQENSDTRQWCVSVRSEVAVIRYHVSPLQFVFDVISLARQLANGCDETCFNSEPLQVH